MVRTYRNPKSLVDRLASLYRDRKTLEAQTEELAREEARLLEQALVLFKEKGVTQCAMNGYKVTLGTKPIATITNWGMLVGCVAAHAEDDRYLSVIHKRVSPTQLETLSYDQKFVQGVVLEHKKVATFSAPRERRGTE